MMLVEVKDIPKTEDIVDAPLDEISKVYRVCQELREVCEKEGGIGISAVQVGIPWRLFLIKGDGNCPLIPEGEYGYFANCNYEATENEQVVSIEGCLSIRSPEGQLRLFEVNRYKEIKIYGYMINDFEKVELDDALSIIQQGIVFQHEIDHQQGHKKLISEIGKEISVW